MSFFFVQFWQYYNDSILQTKHTVYNIYWWDVTRNCVFSMDFSRVNCALLWFELQLFAKEYFSRFFAPLVHNLRWKDKLSLFYVSRIDVAWHGMAWHMRWLEWKWQYRIRKYIFRMNVTQKADTPEWNMNSNKNP